MAAETLYDKLWESHVVADFGDGEALLYIDRHGPPRRCPVPRMTPFTILTSVAAPMPEADVDTDIIFPARFLLLTEKTGLGRCAFHEKRYTPAGVEQPDFVLNRPPWRQAQILVSGPNFGCGSSREQAPWALADLGIRCIIAPGFGEIFRANCFANGLLPIVLAGAAHNRLLQAAEAAELLTVDLMGCDITTGPGDDQDPILFEVPHRQREALLLGLDEIGLTLCDQAAHIAAFERRRDERMPWLAAPASLHP